MSSTDGLVNFMYGSTIGRAVLKVIMKTRADRIMVRFLKSGASKIVIKHYVQKNDIDITDEEQKRYKSFHEFFIRERVGKHVDFKPEHLISPCDGWLSTYHIEPDSTFEIKGSRYRIQDIVKDRNLSKKYTGGTCIVIRLSACDYHHYCFIDDGWQGNNHFIPGELHSVQPSALERYPVFALNRRSWCILETEHFGQVVQTEIGAIVVGGIVNDRENERVRRGEEKGHFELAGSTIVLMFEPGRIRLLPRFSKAMADNEIRVKQGMWIGIKGDCK